VFLSFSFTATVPTIVQGLGYTSTSAQLMTIPIYVVAMCLVLAFAWASDHFKQRTPFIIGGAVIAIIGFIGQLAIPHPHMNKLSYAFLFFIAAGLFAPVINVLCLAGNNLAPSSKRAVGMAVLLTFGNWGGIWGSNVYVANQAPSYPLGYGTGLGVCVASILAAFALRWGYNRENKKRDAFMEGKTDEEVRAMYTTQELLDLGDLSPFFRYTL
jgi:MFS family permease